MERAERLREDRSTIPRESGDKEFTTEWRKVGFGDGRLAARNPYMTPTEGETIEEAYEEWRVSSGEEDAASEYIDKEIFSKWMAEDSIRYKQQDPEFNQNAYVAGWMQGVVSVRREKRQ